MSNLLEVIRFNAPLGKKRPLLVEVPVNPELAPYLVTSSTAVLWVDECHPGGLVKAAVRKVAPGALFREILEAVILRGLQDGWENVHPYTEAGLAAAIQHLEYYDLENFIVLAPPGQAPAWLNPEEQGTPVRPSSWVPEGTCVIIPRDLTFVGMLGHLDAHYVVAVVHNACRSICVLRTNH